MIEPDQWWLSVVQGGNHWGYNTQSEAERAPHVGLGPHRIVHVVPIERAERAERECALLRTLLVETWASWPELIGIGRSGDGDDSSATFWGNRDLRDVLRKMLEALDAHYAAQKGFVDG